MAAHDVLPEWVAGISIGAINAALIAGNPPERRVERLRAFWEEITSPSALWPAVPAVFADTQRFASTMAALFGQPGFFRPRAPLNWLGGGNVTSYYDTSPLRATLEDLVDFDLINTRRRRLSVGAVNVRTGRLVWFDTATTLIKPEHIMASGALPPGFPPVEIGGEMYWDGGVVSNTPLQHVIDDIPRRSRLCFQVDLFHATGELPENLDEVNERMNDIRYASRTRRTTEAVGQVQTLRQSVAALYALLPEDLKASPLAKRLQQQACGSSLDIVHLIYRPLVPQGAAKDYEFSRVAMQTRWDQGQIDAEETLSAAPWRAQHGPLAAVRVFDVAHDRLLRRQQMPAAQR
jgi:NTE family protein